jgi:LuxR family transcriptional regulator, maltose regulon positive regulatory protein
VARPLVETKFFAPRSRQSLVQRTRLVKRLERGADARLTLISAPAGFGKTTLLAGWLEANASANRAIAWLSLEPADNDPTTFWA